MSSSPTPRSRRHSASLAGWRPFKNGITSLTVDIVYPKPRQRPSTVPGDNFDRRGGNARPQRDAGTSSGVVESVSRWNTVEFYLYYVVFSVAIPYMVKVAVDLSRESHPNYRHFQHRLQKGWIFGWQIDKSDHQWNVFRKNIPILAGLVILWLVSSRLYFGRSLSPTQDPTDTSLDTPDVPSSSFSPTKDDVSSPFLPKPTTTAPPSISSRTTFILCFAIPLITLLHGTSIIKIFALLTINYAVSRLATRVRNRNMVRIVPILCWALNLGLLFGNELSNGYTFGSISPQLAFLDAEWVKGILPRWQVNWNITMLRLISFDMDYHWATTSHPPSTPDVLLDEISSTAKFTSSPVELTERLRATSSHPLSAYSYKTYIAYALYPPLYLAGPIITFNSFYSQLLSPPKIQAKQLISYGIRFFACLLTMELVLSSMYVVAIKDSSRAGAWLGDSPFELSMIGFWNLIVVWLKLLIPWRFFRFWSLLDGIDPPENMVRCMANNYSTLGFWRSWHRSYNLWVVRYLYIPLGGSKHAIVATLVVFTFVALWHDLSLKLLTWGWVISLFVLPEMAAKKFVPSRIYGGNWWYRHVAAMGGVVNVLMMMTANLIGFAIGTEGMGYMWGQMIGSWEGVKFMLVASFCLFVGVQFMFEYREEEARRGIVRNC